MSTSATSRDTVRPCLPGPVKRSRSAELSSSLLDLIGRCAVALRREVDPRTVLTEPFHRRDSAEIIARHLENILTTFQSPTDRILVEQIIGGPHPTYLITTCRGRGFNTALYFMAGLAEQASIPVIEMSFDENGLLLKRPKTWTGAMYRPSRRTTTWTSSSGTSSGANFAKRFRKLRDAASSPQADWCGGNQPATVPTTRGCPPQPAQNHGRVHPHP